MPVSYDAPYRERTAEPDEAEYGDESERLALELKYCKKYYSEAVRQRDELSQELYELQGSSIFWKLAKWEGAFKKSAKKILKSNRVTYIMGLTIRCLIRKGVGYTWAVIRRRLCRYWPFYIFRGKSLSSKKELDEQRGHVFPIEVKFSIVVPLYNTPERFLNDMIQSVESQTYGDWELCLADGSDEQHAYVELVCRRYAEKDGRVLYKKLDENTGISGNTNACIDMASGDYIAFMDHDDVLHPAALYNVMGAICEHGADLIYTDEKVFRKSPNDAITPHYKPDYAPDSLRANNYMCHFTAVKRSFMETVGRLDPEMDGSQDFDFMLRATEKTDKIVHVPKVLYYWRSHPDSVAGRDDAKPYAADAARRAVQAHLERVGLEGEVLDTPILALFRIKYKIYGEPLVSILIPNKDHREDLSRCLDSIFEKTTYGNFEIIVIENNSTDDDIFEYYDEIQYKWPMVRVVAWRHSIYKAPDYFNYSAINNFGAEYAKGDYLLLLNNDTEVIAPDWIQEMLMFAQRGDVGAVGAKLYYPDGTIQHAGIGIGIYPLAGHYHRNFPHDHCGYMGRLIYAQDLSAVTGACLMVPRAVWDQIGGLDDSFEVACNDVDMCLRIRKAGYLVVWTPYAELYHYESKTRGLDDELPERKKRFFEETDRMKERWAEFLEAGDPYYNPNLTREGEDLSER